MDYLINSSELGALSGLPHLQQLAYLIGIRPYMDVKTGIVGIKRGISYQSIAESLYSHLPADEERFRGLERENEQLKRERDILKKA